ncbi:hypothetical protein AQUCO_03400266v1 [Aquilegia coerulea]|uniref:F-box domain-containing protein n=1 Tax=Aquilegia coerulea TaxID=218851 RepID=A0A2G5CY83_AQUCA|nr:hypothetical protein AQUCO_03400266v1 [Aquilegia coerulea]
MSIINDLDEGTLIQIICKLPIKQVLRCKSVSKSWQKLITYECIPRLTSSCPVHGLLSNPVYEKHNRDKLLNLNCTYSPSHVISKSFSIKFSYMFDYSVPESYEFVGYCNGFNLFYDTEENLYMGVTSQPNEIIQFVVAE